MLKPPHFLLKLRSDPKVTAHYSFDVLQPMIGSYQHLSTVSTTPKSFLHIHNNYSQNLGECLFKTLSDDIILLQGRYRP